MDKLLAIPVVLVLVMLQIGIFGNLTLLHGSPDIVLVAVIVWALNERVESGWSWGIAAGLMVGFISAHPLIAILAGYLLVTGFARYLHKRVWQAPFMAVLITTLFGTVVMATIALTDLRLRGSGYLLEDAVLQIVLPSLLMNLLFALPIHILFLDFVDWVYPLKDEV